MPTKVPFWTIVVSWDDRVLTWSDVRGYAPHVAINRILSVITISPRNRTGVYLPPSTREITIIVKRQVAGPLTPTAQLAHALLTGRTEAGGGPASM